MRDWTKTVTTNLKLVAAGAVGVLIAGTGAATTVSLVSDESAASPSVVTAPSSGTELVTASDTPTVTIAPSTVSPSATATVAIRPTDTHGYCVSTAVHAVTAPVDGGNLGAAKSAAAHSCKKDESAKVKNDKSAKVKKDKSAKVKKAAKSAKVKKAAKADKPEKAHPGKGKHPTG
jgi:hypothetical protein